MKRQKLITHELVVQKLRNTYVIQELITHKFVIQKLRKHLTYKYKREISYR